MYDKIGGLRKGLVCAIAISIVLVFFESCSLGLVSLLVFLSSS